MTLGIFILGIIAIAAAVVLFFVGSKLQFSSYDRNELSEYEEKFQELNRLAAPLLARVLPILLLGIGGAMLFNSFFVEVPAGTRGVRLAFKAASDGALEPGLQFKWPWQDVETLSTQKHEWTCLLYTSPSPRDQRGSRMPSSA